MTVVKALISASGSLNGSVNRHAILKQGKTRQTSFSTNKNHSGTKVSHKIEGMI